MRRHEDPMACPGLLTTKLINDPLQSLIFSIPYAVKVRRTCVLASSMSVPSMSFLSTVRRASSLSPASSVSCPSPATLDEKASRTDSGT